MKYQIPVSKIMTANFKEIAPETGKFRDYSLGGTKISENGETISGTVKYSVICISFTNSRGNVKYSFR
jgi:hypothetical protein